MILNSELIPHENFHKGFWLKTKSCPWFFFYESPREFKLPNNREFYNSLDEDLKGIVMNLHSKKIPTTPSCSGHIKSDEHYDKIYKNLVHTKNLIKKDGVELLNPETNRKFFYKNQNYKLPYTKDEFLRKLRKYQTKGVLGIVDDGTIFEKLKGKTPIKKSDNITLIMTEGKTPKEISNKWKEIEKILKDV
jgi:hypothetical protein